MWIERTTFVTAYPLPGILRWFAVTSTTTVRRRVRGERGLPRASLPQAASQTPEPGEHAAPSPFQASQAQVAEAGVQEAHPVCCPRRAPAPGPCTPSVSALSVNLIQPTQRLSPQTLRLPAHSRAPVVPRVHGPGQCLRQSGPSSHMHAPPAGQGKGFSADTGHGDPLALRAVTASVSWCRQHQPGDRDWFVWLTHWEA